ncbi:MAG TPA: porin family protein [Bacteroidales bacterium]|nr:porin family protein [Bacteroidales bacterium]
MKKIIAILIVVLVSIPAFSQLKVGIKAGLSTNSISMGDIKTVTTGNTTYAIDAVTSAKYGFQGGLFVRASLFGLYLQPELLLSTRTNEYSITNTSPNISQAPTFVKQNFTKLDIPVLLGFKLGPLRINAGPSGSILLNTPKELIDSPDLKNLYSKMTIGYQAGLGFDLFRKLTFDLRYEGSLKKYQNQIENLTGTKFNIDDRPNAFIFSVGIMF